MPDYSEGKIYRLQSLVTPHYYVGSTCKPLHLRLTSHKVKMKHNCACWEFFSGIGWNNVEAQLIEEYPTDTKEALLQREDEYFRAYSNDPNFLNMQRPCLPTWKRQKWKRQYYLANIERITQHNQAYRKTEAGKRARKVERERYRERAAEVHRLYREAHKAELKHKKADYHRQNKERIAQQRKATVECPVCHSHCTKGNLSAHQKTQKCRQLSDAKTV